jgi:hypothetical protein
VPVFLSAKRVSDAIYSAGNSRAKGSLLDFLILKRALVIKGTKSIAIVEKESAFISALKQFADCGIKEAPGPYINIFSITRNTGGYLTQKYSSNGLNSTVAGSIWSNVVQLDRSKTPREVSLLSNSDSGLETLALKSGKDDKNPKIDDVAIWYLRGGDIESIVATSPTAEQKLDALRARFVSDVGLTPTENLILFDMTPATIDSFDFVATRADPNDYLPKITTELALTPASVAASCSLDLVTALTSKRFVILTGPSGTGKSRAALKMAEGIQRSMGASVKGDLFQVVPVGPDWTSPKRLLGFRTPFGRPESARTTQ